MCSEIIYVEEKTNIPLFGVDFLGIIDRGTNIIELKPSTLCNLKCRYCFVSGGNYSTDFIVNQNYMMNYLKELVKVKDSDDIEIHFSPYGEILLYPELFTLLKNLGNLNKIQRISLQSNGLLLTKEMIDKLNHLHVTRINLSVNTLNQDLARYLCNDKAYDIEKLLEQIEYALTTDLQVLIAPVWFPGENDQDMIDIIKHVKALRNKGFSDKKIQLGIQKYLIYSTGRKLKKIRPKSWGYFYHQLSELEKEFNVKLKLGPNDFDIRPCQGLKLPRFQKNALVKLKIVSQGRWNNECIGIIKDNQNNLPPHGMKILINYPFTFSPEMLGKEITAKIIKANYKNNIITGSFPP